MSIFEELSKPVSQAAFARMLGRSEARISQLANDGTLAPDGTAGEWLHAYVDRLSAEAAGRASDGPLDLSQERAALARSQREVNEVKLATLRGEYASIALLAQTLATASQAVTERFDQLPGLLKRRCPTLPTAAREHVQHVIADARNEWVKETCELVSARIEVDDDNDDGVLAPDAAP